LRDLPKINLVYFFELFFGVLTGAVNVFEKKLKMYTMSETAEPSIAFRTRRMLQALKIKSTELKLITTKLIQFAWYKMLTTNENTFHAIEYFRSRLTLKTLTGELCQGIIT
jgi:hypothetical protein